MSREDLLRIPGVVTEALSAGQFRITLEDGKTLNAHLSGRLRRFYVRVLVGDKVTVGLSTYDLSHGLILSRERLDGPKRKQ